MTHEKLHNLIFQANNNNCGPEAIYSRPIHEYVDVAEVHEPLGPMVGNEPYTVYFIYSGPYKRIGVVLVMGENDLHAYTLPEHRRQGHMKYALKNVIVPHLFWSRDKQRVTVNEEHSTPGMVNMMESIGFKTINIEGPVTILEMEEEDCLVYNEQKFLPQVGEDEFESLKREAEKIKHQFAIMRSRLETYFGSGLTMNDKVHLDKASRALNISSLLISDAYYACQKQDKEGTPPMRWNRYTPNFSELKEEE